MTEPMVMRSIRVPLDLWEQAKAQAAAERRDLSVVVRELLEVYLLPVEPDPDGDVWFAAGARAGRLEALGRVRDAVGDLLDELVPEIKPPAQ